MSDQMTSAPPIPSVNFHLWRPCNMRCRFCFATFQDLSSDVLPKGHLPKAAGLMLVDRLADAGFKKINFAGGEPTLCPWLDDLIRAAHRQGMATSIVTNGSFLTPEWLDQMADALDWIGLSIDTLAPDTAQEMGRVARGGPISRSEHEKNAKAIRKREMRLKINTVVTTANKDEDLSGFLRVACPERWKIFQVLPVEGQNDGHVESLLVTDATFRQYVERHAGLEDNGIRVVAEDNTAMTGSYAMVDPAGRFFDNTAGKHTYSRPILDVGVRTALEDVSVLPERFKDRGGRYDW